MPPQPGRFHRAAHHYLHGRPPYAKGLIGRVAQLCQLGPVSRLLDLGCGPGALALEFAPLVGQVVGIDPEPEMLHIARQEAARAGPRIDFRLGSSEELGADLGAFQLVVIGRAFHWMDREQTLACLDRLVEPDGAVALFKDSHPKVPENRWLEAFDELTDRYAQADLTRAHRRGPDWLSHEAVLLDSPFCDLERIGVIERRQTPVERFVDRALSMSSVSQAGAATDALAREVGEMMSKFAKDAVVNEVVESEALIARRRGA
jgi:SAM-dependent methyltransferase